MRKEPTGAFTNRGIFKNLVEFINANAYSIVFRKDMIKNAYKDDGHLPWGSRCTVDKWRRELEVLGYLDRLAPGKYYVMREIPDELDTTNLEKLYMESAWDYNPQDNV